MWLKGSFWSSNDLGVSFVKGGGFVGLDGRSLRSCTNGCGDVGGDPNNSIGSSLGDGDGVLDGWVGALGGVGSEHLVELGQWVILLVVEW